MALSIKLRGVELTQEQVDACIPVVNHRLRRGGSEEAFEQGCITAMEIAGCPFVPVEVEEVPLGQASAEDGYLDTKVDGLPEVGAVPNPEDTTEEPVDIPGLEQAG